MELERDLFPYVLADISLNAGELDAGQGGVIISRRRNGREAGCSGGKVLLGFSEQFLVFKIC